MRVVQVSAFIDHADRPAAALLEAWPTLAGVARAAAEHDNVTVLHAARHDEVIARDGVTYRFICVDPTNRARDLATAMRQLKPDVMHLQGLGFPSCAAALSQELPHVPLLVQDHADRLPPIWRRPAWRRGMRGVDAVSFTALAQAQPFLDARIFAAHTAVVAIPESSSAFVPLDRDAARSASGIHGDPCVLWVARLNQLKDPLTALRAFRIALDRIPHARLWMCFTDAPLLDDVRAAIASDPLLEQRVVLLGRVPHETVRQLASAADIYFSTSHAEGSGYALMEAMACGATPVITDIPPYRALTGNGSVGGMFAVGDAAAAADALLRAASTPMDRHSVRACFERNASFDVVGSRLARSYRECLTRRRSPRVVMLTPGGIDATGTHVIPTLLTLVERVARSVDLHVITLRQTQVPDRFTFRGATVHSLTPRRALTRIRQLHRGRRLRCLHAIWMHPSGTVAAAAGAALRVPVLLELNGGDMAAIPDIGYGARLRWTGRARLSAAVAGADRIIAGSDAMCEAAARLGIHAERLTYGVPLDEWPAAEPRARTGPTLRLLSVGYLNAVKDHSMLLRTAARLAETDIDFTWRVIGDGTLRDSLVRMRDELGLGDRVTFEGFKPHEQLRPYYDDADVLVMTSRHESEAKVVLEAAVSGLAVVGTHVGHLADFSPHAACTVECSDDTALALVIQQLANDDDLRMTLAWNAQRIALQHDADSGAARILDCYGITLPAPELSAAVSLS